MCYISQHLVHFVSQSFVMCGGLTHFHISHCSCHRTIVDEVDLNEEHHQLMGCIVNGLHMLYLLFMFKFEIYVTASILELLYKYEDTELLIKFNCGNFILSSQLCNLSKPN